MKRMQGCLLLTILMLTLPKISLATEVKDWTLLVYLNGHNNLDEYGASNIKQMERVGSTDKVNVVVQWASMASPVTKRIYVTKSTNPNAVTSPSVEELSPVDMGNSQSLVEFVRWAKERYPARHYFIDVWNHGSGWHRISSEGVVHQSDISFDERFGTHITTQQLGAAIQTISTELGQKVDVYGSDACMMAMAEVAGEMKHSVEVFAGAEETEPGDGWPYDQLLGEWNKLEHATASEVGAILVREYVKAYTKGGQFGEQEVTFSAMKMSEYEKFETAFLALANDMQTLTAADQAAVLRVSAKTQSYTYSDYKDLTHFTKGLADAGLEKVKHASLSALQSALSSLIIENGVTGRFTESKGISFWMPDSAYQYTAHSEAYAPLVFNQDTGWGSVLSKLFPRR
ncbi:MAG: clostripain-related cysteine peptidase [Bdellovibrionota bacterium]